MLSTASLRRVRSGCALGLAALALASSPAPAAAQPAAAEPSPLQQLNDQYGKAVSELQLQHLKRLSELVPKLSGEEADLGYGQLLNMAASLQRFREVEAQAKAAIGNETLDPEIRLLGRLVAIMAAADAGNLDEAVKNLESIVKYQPNELAALPLPARINLSEALYRRLVSARRYEQAKKLAKYIVDTSKSEELRGHFTNRLARVDLVGKPAPAIEGVDLDGEKVSLAALKGKAVLVVFWASWNLPSHQAARRLQEAYDAHEAQGFAVVGVCLDRGGRAAARRAAVESNISFPNIINGEGAEDFAKAYHVTDVPTAVMIDREGNIADIDLHRGTFEESLRSALGAEKK